MKICCHPYIPISTKKVHANQVYFFEHVFMGGDAWCMEIDIDIVFALVNSDLRWARTITQVQRHIISG